MGTPLTDLVQLLDLETLEHNLYRGQSRNLGGKSVFGGQVVSQALVAGYRTLSDARIAHSLHAYFLRPGDMDAPIIYDVDRIRDGRSFTTRRINAIQHGRPIFTMMASYQREEPGLAHAAPMPDVPPPEDLEDQHRLRERWADEQGLSGRLREAYLRELPILFKPVDPRNPFSPEPRPASQQLWFKARDALPEDALLHQSVVAYASDFALLGTAMRPHGVSYLKPKMAVASLDHAIWFHHAARADDWLLYVMDSPFADGARGLSRGLIYNRAGQLVASTAQESLMRVLEPGS